jgi:Cdc6-like AAA superfamily ATPase
VSDRQISAAVSSDELKMLELLRSAGEDADVEVIRRDGRVVDVRRTTRHQKEFKTERLQEPMR